jgi:hypothetical protein
VERLLSTECASLPPVAGRTTRTRFARPGRRRHAARRTGVLCAQSRSARRRRGPALRAGRAGSAPICQRVARRTRHTRSACSGRRRRSATDRRALRAQRARNLSTRGRAIGVAALRCPVPPAPAARWVAARGQPRGAHAVRVIGPPPAASSMDRRARELLLLAVTSVLRHVPAAHVPAAPEARGFAGRGRWWRASLSFIESLWHPSGLPWRHTKYPQSAAYKKAPARAETGRSSRPAHPSQSLASPPV